MKGLKITLWICGVCWMSGFVSAVLPWEVFTALCKWMGIHPPEGKGITILMFRLACISFGMIGIFFVILARNPIKHDAMLQLAAYGLLCCYVPCSLLGGIRYGLPSWTYAGDAIFGTVAGVLLFIFRKQAMMNIKT
jgi:hypothetical protein